MYVKNAEFLDFAKWYWKKGKTFNQEVEHFCRVLEAEISKKEC